MEGFGSPIRRKKRQIQIREVQKHTDPTDPDPQHCNKEKPSNHAGEKIILGWENYREYGR
jgi:hypothetical protein